jgi:hypothetical protein
MNAEPVRCKVVAPQNLWVILGRACHIKPRGILGHCPRLHRRNALPSTTSFRRRICTYYVKLKNEHMASRVGQPKGSEDPSLGLLIRFSSESTYRTSVPPIVRRLSPLDPSRSAAILSQHSVHHRWRARHAGSRRLRARSECRLWPPPREGC